MINSLLTYVKTSLRYSVSVVCLAWLHYSRPIYTVSQHNWSE